MSAILNIHENPHPTGLPPPWFRPPADVTKGPTRKRASIIAGPLISNQEGRRWLKERFNFESTSASHDYNIPYRLNKLVQEKGIAFASCTAPRRLESAVSDILVITQICPGPFRHDGPENYEEVYEENRKAITGVLEEEVKARLEKELGINTIGFKCYYSNAY